VSVTKASAKNAVRDGASLAARYRVDHPKGFRLADVDPGDTAGVPEALARTRLAADVERLADLQERLYAQDRWAVLVLFQGMDAAGKDSTISHLTTGLNPTGVQIWSFRAPNSEELAHDYLWRHAVRLPERGNIGIHNRSWYEEVLVAKVEPDVLAGQKLPPELVTKSVWHERYEDIAAYERFLARNGVLVLKFLLHVSKDEQRKRFLARIDTPAKNWKFKLGDVEKRARWDAYMKAYEKMIRRTSRPHARWHVVPADHKWFTRLVVAATIVEAVEALDPRFPTFDRGRRSELAEARRRLLRERG
jgi:PPK2 family polyphosphate:nucleotide phosphotransferase